MINALTAALIEEQRSGVEDSAEFTKRLDTQNTLALSKVGDIRDHAEALRNAASELTARATDMDRMADALEAAARDTETLKAWVLDCARVRAENLDKLIGIPVPARAPVPATLDREEIPNA